MDFENFKTEEEAKQFLEIGMQVQMAKTCPIFKGSCRKSCASLCHGSIYNSQSTKDGETFNFRAFSPRCENALVRGYIHHGGEINYVF